jgi:hypothetical protein
MSEIGDAVYSNNMVERKIKKCYSTTLEDDDSFDEQRSVFSEMV